MNFMVFDALDANGLKGSQADVEGDFGGFNTTEADAIENFRGEMKSGGGRGDGTALLRVDGLIAIAVAGGIETRDVGRERDVADAIEDGIEIFDRLKADMALAETGAGKDFRL
jgi:hypothetical protein